MTIALGVLTPSAFLLAADQQEGTGYPGDMKARVGKIDYSFKGFASPVSANASKLVCVTGCGPTGYLTLLKQRITAAFIDDDAITLDTFEPLLQNIIADFWRDHIVALAAIPNLNLDMLRLIVAAQHLRDKRLWVTEFNAIRRAVHGFESVGSGERWARNFSRGVFFMADKKLAGIAAVYAVYIAKRYAEGCGGDTDIVLVEDGFPIIGEPNAVLAVEELFRKYERLDDRLMRYCLGSRTAIVSDGFEEAMQSLRNELAAIDMFPYPDWAKPKP